MNEVGLRLDELDTPVLWVDLERLERNIERVAAHLRTANVAWRPHTKGIKVPALAHKLLQAGAIGVTCAKLGEAEVMAAAGIRDILIANQVVGAHKYVRLANLCRHADVKIAVDSTATLASLSEVAVAKGVELGIVIEIDTGMHRAGVQPGEPVMALAEAVAQTPGLAFLGVMAWEGHALSADTPQAKRRAVEAAIQLLTESAEQCRRAGLPVSIVSCGGSGTYQITPFLPGITEIQAGGLIFSDATYTAWGVQSEPALFVRSVVSSRPTADRIIFDAGFKTLPTWFKPPQPLGLEHVKTVVMSAEHGIVTLERPNMEVAVGDFYDFMVGYGDATVFLHNDLYGVRDGTVEVVWPIAGRGRLR